MREVNDWMMFNSIVYKIYTVRQNREMREKFLEQLKMLIDFDAADFYLARRDKSQGLEDPVFYHCEGVYPDKFDEIDYSRGILYSGVCRVYRETDIVSDEIRVETDYYHKLYRPNGWHYSVQMILAYDKKFVGAVTLYRTVGKENFSHDDTMFLDLLKDHLAFRLHYEYADAAEAKTADIGAFSEKYSLTRREESVLLELWSGKDNQSISEELAISIYTLKKHILNIYRKTGVNSKGQLMNKVAKWSISCTEKE